GCGGAKPAAHAKPSSAVAIKASDTACEASATSLPSGLHTFTVTNRGSQVTEFYVYGAGDRIIGEVENIGPATSRDLIRRVPPGSYEMACKPGMTGDGIRRPLRVTGTPLADLPVDQQLQQAVAGYRRFVATETKTLVATTAPFVAAVKAG